MTLPSSQVAREGLVEALELDLIGPCNGHAFERELLERSPRNWYLTGMLVPVTARVEAKEDPAAQEDLDAPSNEGTSPDDGTPDKASTRRGYLPSSIGISFLVHPGTVQLKVRAEWGEYSYEGQPTESGEEPAEEEVEPSDRPGGGRQRKGAYRRSPCNHEYTLELADWVRSGTAGVREIEFAGSGGMGLAIVLRKIDPTRVKTLPAGTLSISLFLVNRKPEVAKHVYRCSVFQPKLIILNGECLIPRRDLRGEGPEPDWDGRVADLQYRDAREYAVGHGIAVRSIGAAGGCDRVETAWIPRASVERVEAASMKGVQLSMERLGRLGSVDEARAELSSLGEQYAKWIQAQKATSSLNEGQRELLQDLSRAQEQVLQRIRAGIEILADAKALEAFCIANRVMAVQARRRQSIVRGIGLEQTEEPLWRPFQLAFLLMGLRGIVDPRAEDRKTVDLLFFPTGGGKTEAYLGLAAFTLSLRRLRNPGIESAGVTVLMRYTLRLLTLDQLGRAAALICALEVERARDRSRLGTHPFEIGLWVGQGATPNRMGERKSKAKPQPNTALARTLDFKEGRSKTPPIPLEACPWCGAQFEKSSFHLYPDVKQPTDLMITCVNEQCDFSGDRYLPIIAVDEPLYRRLPCFVISTVDKFAALPWTEQVGQLLGHVDRHLEPTGISAHSFSRGGGGRHVHLLPPDLIIQDELHLISGPLGTIAGIYEGAIDRLAARDVDGVIIRPKIVASTATVRRADDQIRALFNRDSVTVFPPAGPDRRDSFFARSLSESESPGRLYVGVAAQGRSMKVVYLRVLMALMAAAKRGYDEGRRDSANSMDPYMTALAYFNSLRELGGSRRIAEDELTLKLMNPPRRRREPEDRLFVSRKIQRDPLELTSRVETDEVAEAKYKLGLPYSDANHVDLALATNMISVGLDITRLGLMVVLGQPKSSAEYIQATSRVGRDSTKPGLVVTLLNMHKPRDRSHYERFEFYHLSFYRSVEATSVTPTAPRALDRALAPALVGLVRHAHGMMHKNEAAGNIIEYRQAMGQYVEYLADRARSSALPGDEEVTVQRVRAAGNALLDKWLKIAKECREAGTVLHYDYADASANRLLRDVLDPELPGSSPERQAFKMPRSMRDVEASVDLVIGGG